MGFFRVRKSFRICPGVKLNIGKKGITSLSIGKAGATVNLSSKGVKDSGNGHFLHKQVGRNSI